jgi:hypothetical protein
LVEKIKFPPKDILKWDADHFSVSNSHAYEDLFKQVVQFRRLFSAVLRFLTLNFLQYLLNSLERLPVDFSDVLFFVLKEKIASVSVEPDIAENLRRQ